MPKRKPKVSGYSLEELRRAIRYECQKGVHTMGHCSKGCGGAARGGGVCVNCLILEAPPGLRPLVQAYADNLMNNTNAEITDNGRTSKDEPARVRGV